MSRKTKKTRPLMIAVTATRITKASRDLTHGIVRYAAGKPNWRLRLIEKNTPRRYLATQSTLLNRWDGMIGIPSMIRSYHEAAPRRIPYITHNSLGSTANPFVPICAQIACDDFAIGRAGATLFLRNNLRHLAYAGFPFNFEQRHSAMRFEAFKAAAEEAGATCADFQMKFEDDGALLRELVGWLRSLPRPCGVMAYSDSVAQLVIEACAEADLHVPDQIQVIGVDNDEDICETVHPTLTSILPDFEGGGYLSASLLDAYLSGQRRPAKPKTHLYGVKDIVIRASTRDIKGGGRLITMAREYIRLHADENISAVDIADNLNVSLRTLERRAKEILGFGIAGLLRRERLERVRNLLVETSFTLTEVSWRSGFSSPTHLKGLFKKTFGLTMGEYRARNQKK